MLIFNRTDTNEEIQCAENWSEITLGKYTDFVALYLQSFKAIKDDCPEAEEFSYSDLIIKYPIYLKKIVAFWLNISHEDINMFEYKDIIKAWEIISNIITVPSPDLYKSLESFKYKDIKYTIKKDLINNEGNKVYMSGSTFGEVIEFLQLDNLQQEVTAGKYHNLSKQIAILYRAKDEELSDENVFNKAKIFRDLPMDMVWGIAFFLIELRITFAHNTLLSLSEQNIKKKEPHLQE